MDTKRKAEEEMVDADNVQKQKVEMVIKHLFWDTVYDTKAKFKITLPEGFLKAKLEDGTDYALKELSFDMLAIEYVLATLGIKNQK